MKAIFALTVRARSCLAGAGVNRAAAGAAIPGRSVLAEAAAEQLDPRPGVGHRDRSPRPHLGGAPAASLNARERAAEQNPPEAKCCVAAPPVLVFDQSGNLLRSWGGPGAGLRLAGERARHLHRRQRFRLARRQRQEGRPAAEVHHGRQVRAADRQARRGQRQQRHRRLGSPADVAVDAAANEVYVADGYANRRVIVFDSRDRRLQAPLGRLRQQAERRQDAAVRSGQGRRRSSSAIRCTACASTRTAWSTSATAPTTASRSSARTARSSSEHVLRDGDARHRLGLRPRVLARRRRRNSST